MKKTKTILLEKEIVEDIICNKCGNSCRPGEDVPDYYGLVEATFTTGYESTHFDDYWKYTFSLCEGCLFEFFSRFKIPAEKEVCY